MTCERDLPCICEECDQDIDTCGCDPSDCLQDTQDWFENAMERYS